MAIDLKEAAREERRAYHRAWRQAHPEKVREYRQRSWEKRAAEAILQKQSERTSGHEN